MRYQAQSDSHSRNEDGEESQDKRTVNSGDTDVGFNSDFGIIVGSMTNARNSSDDADSSTKPRS